MTTLADKTSKADKARVRWVASYRAASASLAGTVRLPYRPTSFKLSDLRKVVADVKRTQG